MNRNIRRHCLAQYKKWICNNYSYLKWNWPHNVVSSPQLSACKQKLDYHLGKGFSPALCLENVILIFKTSMSTLCILSFLTSPSQSSLPCAFTVFCMCLYHNIDHTGNIYACFLPLQIYVSKEQELCLMHLWIPRQHMKKILFLFYQYYNEDSFIRWKMN